MEDKVKQFIEDNEMIKRIVDDLGMREGMEDLITQFVDDEIVIEDFSLNLEAIYPEIM